MTDSIRKKDNNIIARQWRGQMSLIATFQFAGVFFIIFYYSELVISFHNAYFPDYALRRAVSKFLIWAYNNTNSIQLIIIDKYHYLIIISLFFICIIFLTIAVTALRRLDVGVFIRAAFFFGVGLLAMPAVLLIYVLRWVPVELFTVLVVIFSTVAGVFSYVAPYLGYLIVGGAGVSVSILLIFLLSRTNIGRFVFVFMMMSFLIIYSYPDMMEVIVSIMLTAWALAGRIVAYPIDGLGYIFGFVASAITLIFFLVFICVIALFVISQFGHMFIDSLFDARNVRRIARAAGRFLVGIGFLYSTVIICFPGNHLAQHGATEAYVAAYKFIGKNVNYTDASDFVDNIGSTYLLVIPDEVEPAIVKAFSYGYPPSLELILVSIACLIAFVLIGQQLFVEDRRERLGIAFLPTELVFLLIGAALVVIFALAAAGDAEG